ncbi:MAG: efflux RND transporter permease subunit [Terriglobales bacterium]
MRMIAAALRRPFTVLVLAVVVVGAAVLAVSRMSIDVFPTLDMPVLYVAQPYGGMAPAEMEGYIVNYYETNFLYISGVDHMESRSIQNMGLIKLTFHPGTDMDQAVAETAAYVQRSLAYMPKGIVPPFIMRFDAGSVPVGDLVLSSRTESQGQLDDLAQIRIRPMFAGLAGVSAPPPFGGNPRSIIVSINPDRLAAQGLSLDDVVQAIANGNAVLPSGNARIGKWNRIVRVNTVVPAYQDLTDLPLRSRYGPMIRLGDIATIADAADVVSGYAELNGRRVVYIPVTKHADASTLRVVSEVKAELPEMRQQLPRDVQVHFAFDQSVYVRNALQVLLTEGLLGALLTGLVVWLFLRDARSSLIVVTVIPFALLAAVAGLWAFGQSLNIMTLGGLALAIGILVDEATVAVENIHTHLARGAKPARAALAATREIFLPQLLAMLCVAAVFLPAFFMTGISRSLFIPLALAVGLAMGASFVLSNTLVPLLSVLLLRHHHGPAVAPEGVVPGRRPSPLERLRQGVLRWTARLAPRAKWAVAVYLVGCLALIATFVRADGTDLFPQANTGEFQVRLRAPTGTRLKLTEQLYNQALGLVEREAGPGNVETSLGFVGTQPRSYPINTIYLWTSGPEEAVMQVALRRGSGIKLLPFEDHLRQAFAREMPDVTISFEAGDIIGKIMNLGAPAPIAVNVTGFHLQQDQAYARQVRAALRRIPALRDVQFEQSGAYPAVLINVDRERAAELGLSLAAIGRSLTEATASSRFVARDFWQNPATGVTYQVQALYPPSEVNSLDALRTMSLKTAPARAVGADGNGATRAVELGDVARLDFGTVEEEYDHYNMQRVMTVTANVQTGSLGDAAQAVRAALAELPPPPRGVRVALLGQVQPMEQTLAGLRGGLLLAVAVILLLMTASFQSWRLALAVVSAVPALLVGVLVSLYLFGSTLNIESFMGAIMTIGIAVANGILLITMAEQARRRRQAEWRAEAARDGAAPAESQEAGRRARAALAAAGEGAGVRLRPILMTAAAMIAGMIPMALSLEAGGEQSAPLGQAVIGGLAAATLATLLIMPAVFLLLQRKQSDATPSLDPEDPESREFEEAEA